MNTGTSLPGLVFGNDPEPMFAGRGYLDNTTAIYAAVIIGITGLTTVPINAATRQERGILRRFSVTPLHPYAYFLSDVLVTLVVLAGFITAVDRKEHQAFPVQVAQQPY